jgi:hypothetical protein
MTGLLAILALEVALPSSVLCWTMHRELLADMILLRIIKKKKLPKITPRIIGFVSPKKKIGIITAMNWTFQKLQTSNISNTVQINAIIDNPNLVADIININNLKNIPQKCLNS